MSTVEQPETDPTAGEPWREKYKRQWLQLRGLAFEGMMLDKVMRQNKMARELAQRTADGTLGTPGGSASPDAEDDDMGIRIGDEIHHHHSQPTPPAAAATSSTLGTVAKGAAVAGLMTLGGIGGTAMTAYLLTRPDPIPEEVPAITRPAEPVAGTGDGNTKYGLSVSVLPGPPDGNDQAPMTNDQ